MTRKIKAKAAVEIQPSEEGLLEHFNLDVAPCKHAPFVLSEGRGPSSH